MGLFGKSRMTVRLDVDGMTCGACVRHVEAALEKAPGVKSVQVDLDSGTAVVRARAGSDPEAWLEAVGDAGYTARVAGGEDEASP